ncbi:hypothetical protein DB30_03020 [Enhygromyxa salina]|uniref:Uncharacterized protein n=1 Tax=Enhygromyxa salina TaxID=215803 RepID=A0A0C2CK83_9BACT|nr:hypothetical protein DB30_03020 [Enhygromyxa salina]
MRTAVFLLVGVTQLASCSLECGGCGDLDPVESGEYIINKNNNSTEWLSDRSPQ